MSIFVGEKQTSFTYKALEDAWNQAVGVQNVLRTLRSSSTIDGKFIQPYANMRG